MWGVDEDEEDAAKAQLSLHEKQKTVAMLIPPFLSSQQQAFYYSKMEYLTSSHSRCFRSLAYAVSTIC